MDSSCDLLSDTVMVPPRELEDAPQVHNSSFTGLQHKSGRLFGYSAILPEGTVSVVSVWSAIYLPIITSVDLMITVTRSPFISRSRSADALVMTAVISVGSMVTTISDMTPSPCTADTTPLSWFRALSSMREYSHMTSGGPAAIRRKVCL